MNFLKNHFSQKLPVATERKLPKQKNASGNFGSPVRAGIA
jgi:hypothetical protein